MKMEYPYIPVTGLAILQKLHEITSSMMLKQDDVDYILDQLEERQTLIDAFDKLRAGGKSPYASQAEQDEAGDLMKSMMDMDRKLSAVLESARDEIKEKLSHSVSNQAVLGYTNNALSDVGSYMDYKK